MAKMIILQGTPCAGKSTWAQQQVSGTEDWLIVSKDAIRHGLGDYWILSREKYITAIEDDMIRTGLRMKYNIINDGTNLDPARVSHLKKLAEEASEIIMACKDDDHDHIRYEMGDLLYHLLVTAERYGISLPELAGELNARMK